MVERHILGGRRARVGPTIDPDVWRNVRRSGSSSNSRSASWRRSKNSIEEIRRDHPKFYMYFNALRTSQKRFGSTWNLQETTSPLSSSPRTRRSSTPSRLHGGISETAGRQTFPVTDELKRAIYHRRRARPYQIVLCLTVSR